MRVKPTQPGAIVRDPHTKRPLPPEGKRVPDTSYWRRRLRDGDVELVDEPEPKRKTTGPAAESPQEDRQ